MDADRLLCLDRQLVDSMKQLLSKKTLPYGCVEVPSRPVATHGVPMMPQAPQCERSRCHLGS